MSAIYGEYVTFKHVKTRKVVVLEIEVPEENFQNIINKLGMPVGGESKPVGIALLDKELIEDKPVSPVKKERSLSQIAYLMSQRGDFNSFAVSEGSTDGNECILNYCDIKSKSELDNKENVSAIDLFTQLTERFESWKIEDRYRDNLYR